MTKQADAKQQQQLTKFDRHDASQVEQVQNVARTSGARRYVHTVQ
ncbi:hypothetical protein [uncultured Paraglaciecola sp.]|nr:hypothetical protein [uncultured Paraglaciecola sp.]